MLKFLVPPTITETELNKGLSIVEQACDDILGQKQAANA